MIHAPQLISGLKKDDPNIIIKPHVLFGVSGLTDHLAF